MCRDKKKLTLLVPQKNKVANMYKATNITENESGRITMNFRCKPIFKQVATFVSMLVTLSIAAVCNAEQSKTLSSDIEKEAVFDAMKFVSDWQWTQFNFETNLFEGLEHRPFMGPTDADSHPQGWVYGAFHVGMAKWAKLADSKGDSQYYDKLYKVAKRNKYLFAPRIYNADDYAIGQLYLDLYEKYQDPKMLEPLKVIFNIILNSPSTTDLQFTKIQVDADASEEFSETPYDEFQGRRFSIIPCKSRWCWADALFMAPPVWMHLAEVTGDKRYFDFANDEFWETVNLLWDKEDHLFYRDTRFFKKREDNGQKVIWARGVGWVVAGLARILEHVPADDPQRADYEKIFKQVMARLAGAQQSDGFWRPSVLAPESQPFKEASGTALMTFAYAYGINKGLLDKETYLPVVENAWAALIGVIQPSGKLGWVQPIGAKPNTVSAEDTQVYAVGGFLLAGTEIHKIAK